VPLARRGHLVVVRPHFAVAARVLHPPDNPELRCGVALASQLERQRARGSRCDGSRTLRAKQQLREDARADANAGLSDPALNGRASRQTQATGARRFIASDRLEAEALRIQLGALAADDDQERRRRLLLLGK
jgi:hypothetical protein